MIDDTGGEGGLKITLQVWHNILTVPKWNFVGIYEVAKPVVFEDGAWCDMIFQD